MRRGLVASVVVVGLACSADLRHGLTEDAANEIVVALDEAGIAARKDRGDAAKDDGWVVRVPKGDATAAWRVLKERELPRRREKEFGEVFQKGGLVPSAAEERALFLHALGGKLANMLRAVPGVVDARVHVALEEGRGVGGEASRPVSASVVVKERLAEGERGVESAAVQRLVAGAVAGLKAEAVEVMRVRAAVPRGGEVAMSKVGPFSVSRGTEGLLTAVLVGAVAIIVVLAGLTVWLVLRGARRAAGQGRGQGRDRAEGTAE